MTLPKTITLYGAPHCRDCQRSKNILDSKNIPYLYIDIEQHPSAALEVTSMTNGYQKIPVIVFPDGTVLIEPADEELEKMLRI